MNIIELKNGYKAYNKGKSSEVEALKGIDICIAKGEMVAIEGRSGAGKSTLMHIIGCIDKLTSGKYILDGINVSKLNDSQLSAIRNKKIGVVLQEFGLINRRSAIDNVAVPLIFGKAKSLHMYKECEKALYKLGILNLKNRKVEELSGGQKQRVAIARAIVNQADIILADEPTGALDSRTSEEIMEVFRELNQIGKTVIVITHDKLVSDYCQRKILLFDGKISEESIRVREQFMHESQ